MTHDEIVAVVTRRLSAASAPGQSDEAAFEAARCLDAIDDHVTSPRDFSADFIDRQWARLSALVG